MLRCFVDGDKQEWDAYVFKLKLANNSQMHHSTNTRRFDLVHSRRVLNFTFQSKASTGKILTDAGQRAGFLATIQYSLNHTRAFLQQLRNATS